jgi:beta-glucosidase/6-phospho-beta-glucosidase/beta-galactosidase
MTTADSRSCAANGARAAMDRHRLLCDFRAARQGGWQEAAVAGPRGLAALVREYHARYGLPLFVTETSRSAAQATEWLSEQWEESIRLTNLGLPVHGFTWFPLGDVIDWRHALRVKRGDVDQIGLYDLRREPRAVASAYASLIARARSGSATPTSG